MSTPPDPQPPGQWPGPEPGQQPPPGPGGPPHPGGYGPPQWGPPQQPAGYPPGYGPPAGYGPPGYPATAQAPVGPSRSLTVAFVLWVVLAGLILIPLVLALLDRSNRSAPGGIVFFVVLFLLGAVSAVGSYVARNGQGWGRILATVTGSILGVILLIFEFILLVALIPATTLVGSLGLLILIPMIIGLVGLALIIIAIVFLFRRDASAFIAANRM